MNPQLLQRLFLRGDNSSGFTILKASGTFVYSRRFVSIIMETFKVKISTFEVFRTLRIMSECKHWLS